MTFGQKIIVALLITFLAGFTTVSALLATRVWDPLWNPFRPSPEQVLAQMVQKSKELDTFHLVQNLGIQGDIANINQELADTNFRIEANLRLV